MRFIDPAIKIYFHINDPRYDNKEDEDVFLSTLEFKAYLEDAQDTYGFVEGNLQNASTEHRTATYTAGLVRKIKLSFNVFSEDRREAFLNYGKLLEFEKFLRPINRQLADGTTGQSVDLTKKGPLTVQFAGLPVLREGCFVSPVSYSYEVNKEVGYIQMPGGSKGYNSFFKSSGMLLIPLAYKINFEGKVLRNIRENSLIIDDDNKLYLEDRKRNRILIADTPKKKSDGKTDNGTNDTGNQGKPGSDGAGGPPKPPLKPQQPDGYKTAAEGEAAFKGAFGPNGEAYLKKTKEEYAKKYPNFKEFSAKDMTVIDSEMKKGGTGDGGKAGGKTLKSDGTGDANNSGFRDAQAAIDRHIQSTYGK